MNNTKLTIVQLANKYANAFIEKTRQDSDNKFICLDDRPNTYKHFDRADLESLIFDCHNQGDKLPNDWIYRTIACILDDIACLDYLDNPDIDAIRAELNIEADLTYCELFNWLPSHYEYCDLACDEFGENQTGNIMALIQYGNLFHKSEILEIILQHLDDYTNN